MNLKSLVITLAAIVVFTTTYLLILPAFTLDKEEAAELVMAEPTSETVEFHSQMDRRIQSTSMTTIRRSQRIRIILRILKT